MKIFISWLALTLIGTAAAAQTTASIQPGTARTYATTPGATSSLEAGYGNARDAVSQNFNPSTRDTNNNRLIENGIMMSPGNASSLRGGASVAQSGASATAAGNLLNVSINGSWNTVVLSNNQSNSGAVTAIANNGGVIVKKDGALN